jgi:heme A synthase
VKLLSRTCAALAISQVALGVFDVLARAPTIVQLAHLMLADGVWLALVLTGAAALAETGTASAPSVAAGEVMLGEVRELR